MTRNHNEKYVLFLEQSEKDTVGVAAPGICRNTDSTVISHIFIDFIFKFTGEYFTDTPKVDSSN